MGVFSVPIRVRNWQNRFLPAARRGEEVTCNALVDTGALELALPIELIECLKLEPIGTVTVCTGDGGQDSSPSSIGHLLDGALEAFGQRP